MSFHSIFSEKTILITGHTGFKGSWLAVWLNLLGAKVIGVPRDPTSTPSHFEAADLKEMIEDHRLDIRDTEALKSLVLQIQPDFVFHLAAQSLVRQSYIKPVETYQTNVFGTLNLLEALRCIEKRCIAILITSDKCYDNVEWVWGYKETDSLGGPDPYSASKGATEIIIRSYLKSFFPKGGGVRIAVGRAGNVIGGGDWAQDRLVPDCVRSWANEKTVQLRNPHATRPWQHVLEPLSGYLTLASELHKGDELHGEPFNFGPPANQNYSVMDLVHEISKSWGKVAWKDLSDIREQPYESGLLKLNCDKALHHLNWRAALSFQDSARLTGEWYRSYYDKNIMIRNVSISQIKEYEVCAQGKGMI